LTTKYYKTENYTGCTENKLNINKLVIVKEAEKILTKRLNLSQLFISLCNCGMQYST